MSDQKSKCQTKTTKCQSDLLIFNLLCIYHHVKFKLSDQIPTNPSVNFLILPYNNCMQHMGPIPWRELCKKKLRQLATPQIKAVALKGTNYFTTVI